MFNQQISLLIILILCSPLETLLAQDFQFTSEGQPLKVVNLIKTNDVIWGFDFINQDQILFTEKSGKLKLAHSKKVD